MMGFQRLNHAALYVRDGERLREVGALTGASDHVRTRVLYGHDLDGIEFEVSWLVPADMLHFEPGGMKTMPLNYQRQLKNLEQRHMVGSRCLTIDPL
jgi:catechol-2,3-dioxygenase